MINKHLKLLIIEDERSFALVLIRALTESGWDVSWASDGATGLDIALNEDFAAVMLDVMLPSKNGWEVLEQLKERRPSVPVLLTTALDDLDDKVKGLRLGADDYLVKPFELKELAARLESVVRRERLGRDLVTRVADLTLDRKTRKVSRQGRPVSLTRREYDLLEALASNAGCYIDRDTLQRRVWTDDEAFEKTVDVFVRTLKQKVDVPFGKELIYSSGDGWYALLEDKNCECPQEEGILVA
jgi:two-component system copper resistance phosphate regulon response regulator CusR